MTNHSGGRTPQYILDFIKQICPEYPNLYLASFNEELCLRDATELILSLQRQLSAAQSALAVANSRNQEEIEADRAMTRALAVAETAGVGGQCATCSFRYWEHKGHIIPCPLCRAEAAEARAGEAEKDARRYRHMRNNAVVQDRNGPGLYWYLPRWNRDLPAGERLDAAIDAALGKET